MIFGGYNPDRHEFDPILQTWLYGGPEAPTFWLPHNVEMARAWCEYKEYSRQEGIKKMQQTRRSRERKGENLWRGSLIHNNKIYDIEEFVLSTISLSHEEISKLKTAPASDTLESTGTMELARRGVQVINDEDVDVLNETARQAEKYDEMDPAFEKMLKDLGIK